VKLARAFGHEGTAKFANGVLRQVLRGRDSLVYPPWKNTLRNIWGSSTPIPTGSWSTGWIGGEWRRLRPSAGPSTSRLSCRSG